MLYALQYGEQEQKVLEQCYAGRRQRPEWLRNAPSLLPGLDLYFVAFNELTTCRSFGMGAGPIPWTAIQEYADRHEFDYLDREGLQYIIRAMDHAYLDWSRKEFERKHLSQNAPTGRRGTPIGGH